jgi:acyl-CoA thioester hydrolase
MAEELFVTYCGVIYPQQCDHMGHLNVQHYVARFDEATWRLMAAIGVTPSYIQENQCGVAAIRQNIAYRRELLAGDHVTIRSGILEMSPKQMLFYHEMKNDETGQIAAATVITAVHMDLKTRRACPFPAAIVESANTLIVPITPVI